MKNLRRSISIIALLVATIVAGQENVEVKKTTLKKTFAVEKDGTSIPHTVTIYKTSKTVLSLKEEDAEKLDQTSERSKTYVTKLINIDNQVFDEHDKYVTMRYIQEKGDSFEIVPTPNGFKVIVDEKYVEYVYGEGLYMVDSPDKDYFVVDEFKTI